MSDTKLKWWAGPILRRRSPQRQALFWALNCRCDLRVVCYSAEGKSAHGAIWPQSLQIVEVTSQLFFYFADIALQDTHKIHYEIVDDRGKSLLRSFELGKGEGYRPQLGTHRTRNLLFGSCRKMKFKGDDALLEAARQYESGLLTPDLLALVGDQIYADDLGLREMQWVRRALKILGFNECSERSFGPNGELLALKIEEFYTLKNPWVKSTEQWDRSAMVERFGLTTDSGSNHLFLFSEWIAYYLLHWSPTLIEEIQSRWNVDENPFFSQASLKQIRRLMANVPVIMTADDHDVTDDWNINPQWKANLSQGGRLLCEKAELALFVFQDWGNHPEDYSDSFWQIFQEQVSRTLRAQTQSSIRWDFSFVLEWGNQFIVAPDLRHFRTGPIELSTKKETKKALNTPAGLMEPERLNKLMEKIPTGINRLIFISGTPVYGFELIERMQRLAYELSKYLHTRYFNRILTKIDIENWRADPHEGTPSGLSYHALIRQFYRISARQTLILSGDVHYAFVRGGALKENLEKGEQGLSEVWQINSSAFHNAPDFKWFAGFTRVYNYLFSRSYPKGGIRPQMLSHRRKSIFPDVNFGFVELAADFIVKIYCIDKGKIKLREFRSERVSDYPSPKKSS